MSAPHLPAPAEVEIAPRFVGPPGMGNGGYSAGRFASLLDGPAEVSLRRPVPLGLKLGAEQEPDGSLVITEPAEGAVIAEVRATEGLAGLKPPARPTAAEAAEAAVGSPFLSERHPFPGCFVCGGEHPDGMGVHPGSYDGDPSVCAAPLRPSPSLPQRDGSLAPEIVWAALDCASFTVDMMTADTPYVLASLSAELLAPVPADRPSVVVGWSLGREGRKAFSACAVLSAEGDLLARSRALWIGLQK